MEMDVDARVGPRRTGYSNCLLVPFSAVVAARAGRWRRRRYTTSWNALIYRESHHSRLACPDQSGSDTKRADNGTHRARITAELAGWGCSNQTLGSTVHMTELARARRTRSGNP